MHPLPLDATSERIAVSLLRHLEWQPEGFSLVFLFAAVGPSLQLADWLDQRLRSEERPLQRQEARDDFARDPEALVDALLCQLAGSSGQRGAVWLGLQRHPADRQWNLARKRFLARLNERRFLLERDLMRPLVLVLPADFRSETRDIAPDIWHVRALSAELRVSAPGIIDAQESAMAALIQAKPDQALPAYREWQRIGRGTTPERIFLPTAWRACRELLSAGRPGDAEEVALSALSMARSRVGLLDSHTGWRDVSVALASVGEVARAQGDWPRAETVFRESLNLRRQLAERFGGTPDALDDLAVSLWTVAQLPSGDVAARDEAISIYESLVAQFPGVAIYKERLDAMRAAGSDAR